MYSKVYSLYVQYVIDLLNCCKCLQRAILRQYFIFIGCSKVWIVLSDVITKGHVVSCCFVYRQIETNTSSDYWKTGLCAFTGIISRTTKRGITKDVDSFVVVDVFEVLENKPGFVSWLRDEVSVGIYFTAVEKSSEKGETGKYLFI